MDLKLPLHSVISASVSRETVGSEDPKPFGYWLVTAAGGHEGVARLVLAPKLALAAKKLHWFLVTKLHVIEKSL